jgi:uncharacterized protein YqhQ
MNGVGSTEPSNSEGAGLAGAGAESEKIRLGGMALGNGVLVHGPTAWACAIRTEDGGLKVVAQRKRLQAARVRNPFLRGPARLTEAFALLPQVKLALPEAELPFARPRVLASMVGSAALLQQLRRAPLRPLSRELLTGLVSLAPAAFALRGGDLASYHGAEHVSIGSYEHGTDRPKEHERCGSHLVGPILLTTALGNVLADRAPDRYRPAAKAAAALGSLAASTEIFGWMTRNPAHPVSRALAKPGHELQHRLGTREPTDEQLEVAEASLRACLALELDDDHDA